MNKKAIFLAMMDEDGDLVAFNTDTKITKNVEAFAPLVCKTLDADGNPIDITKGTGEGPQGPKGEDGTLITLDDSGEFPELVIDGVNSGTFLVTQEKLDLMITFQFDDDMPAVSWGNFKILSVIDNEIAIFGNKTGITYVAPEED